VGAPCRIPKPYYRRPQTKVFTPEEEMELLLNHDQNLDQLRQLADLFSERKQLIHQIQHPPTLEECLSSPPPFHSSSYKPPPPIPEDLHFKTHDTVTWIQEVDNVLLATKICLEPIFKELNKEDEREDYGIAVRVPLEHRDHLWRWYSHLEDLYESDQVGCTLTHKEWREVTGACKRIGKVSFHNLSHRLPIICRNLVDLQITLP
ncbi:hypothetical protein GYMLUDRAFT_1021811, partial [Collybiopsis luxurians FD-317 M1]